MPSIKTSPSLQAFNALWDKARAEGSAQGNKVSYAELKAALAPLQAGGLSRFEARHVAETLSSDPVLTAPATKEALAFLKTVGAEKLDSTTVEAIRADFSLRASAPFKSLDVPGREVKNTLDLPDSVQRAMKQTHEKDAEASWESVVTKKATLAGQPVFIVHYSSLDDGNMDAEKVRVFSTAGKELAHGALWDGMAGFMWE